MVTAVWSVLVVGWCWCGWLGTEAVKGGLVAVGWSWLVGVRRVSFGVVGGWEWVVVGVDWWLVTVWLQLGLAESAAMARGGSVEVGCGRCWCRPWGWLVETLDGGVPYCPMQCVPIRLSRGVGEIGFDVIWVSWGDVASV